MDSFGRLGEESSTFIDQLAASVVGGRDGGSMATKEAVKERLLQIVSVTTQVAISRMVSRFKLQLRDHQEARRSREGGWLTHTHAVGMELGCGIGGGEGWRVDGREGSSKKMSSANHICGYTGRHFEEGVTFQTPA